MSQQMTLPQLGENVESGVVLQVLVSKGDHIDKDQPVLELETDKATTEVPSTVEGVVEEVLVAEGDEIKGGQPILKVKGEKADQEDADQEDADREGEDEGEKKDRDGAAAKKGESKSEAKAGAGANEERREADTTRDRGEARRAKRKPPREEPAEPRPEPARPSRGNEPPLAAPHIRQLARELGVVIDDVAGTGDGGRITEDDVKSHVRTLLSRARESGADEGPRLPDFSRWGEVEREPLSAVRRATARHVATAWERIPHVTQYDRADITELLRFRDDEAGEAEEAGGKLTITAILVKVLGAALARFPRFNASIDIERGERILKKYVHIGVAVDTGAGLLVPVVRDVNDKGLLEVARELGELAAAARDRRLGTDAMQGAGMSLTNLGGLGTTHFTPIIQWPQVAILGVGRSRPEAVVRDGEIVARTLLPLGVTYDHRAVDGADAARFLRWICETLEQPMRLTLKS